MNVSPRPAGAVQRRDIRPWRRTRALVATVGLVAGLMAVQTVTLTPAGADSSALVTDVGCRQNSLARNDDGSTPQVQLPFTVNFFGTSYSSLWVNNNGNVTFTGPQSTYTPFNITADTPPIIAPFFADVDTRNQASSLVTYGITQFQGRTAFCVDWFHVGYYYEHTDKTNTFQLLLVNTDQYNDFDIVFNYGQIQWETGDASGGQDGLGGESAGAGFSNGDGQAAHFYQFPGTLQPGSFLDGGPDALASHSNVSIPGRFVFHVTNGHVVPTAATCTDVYFISVRGSGESSTGISDQGNSPHGSEETYLVWQDFLAHLTHPGRLQLPASDVTFYQLPYPALAVAEIVQGLSKSDFIWHFDSSISTVFDTNLPTYLAGALLGVEELTGYIQSVQRTCAAQHMTPTFVLAGYSQGAMVIHEYLYERALAQDSVLSTEIGGVALVADPMRVSTQGYLGTASHGGGICELGQQLVGVDNCFASSTVPPIPAAVAGRTFSLCDYGDAVCDPGPDAHDLLAFVYSDFETGIKTHLTYPARGELPVEGNMLYSAVATFMLGR